MSEVLEPGRASLATVDENDGDGSLSGPHGVVVRLPPAPMEEEQFIEFCGANPELQIERTANGEVIIMFPEFLPSGIGNAELLYQVMRWSKEGGGGQAAGSSAGFTLANRATRAPDVAWISDERLSRLTPEDRERFPHLCPDFVIELRSQSDSLRVLKEKMEEYIANGARLAWLLNPGPRTVFVYRPGQPAEELRDPQTLSGESVLPGLVLSLPEVWKAMAG